MIENRFDTLSRTDRKEDEIKELVSKKHVVDLTRKTFHLVWYSEGRNIMVEV